MPEGVDEIGDLFHKLRCLGRGDPAGPQPLVFNTGEGQHLGEDLDPLFRAVITVQVIAFRQMSAAHKDAVNPLLKGPEHVVGRNTARTHHPDDPDIGRILHTTDPSQVSSRVRSPGAKKSNDMRFELFAHWLLSFF